MEDKEEMRKRVYEAAEVMAKGTGQSREQALERIGVSPQCGFASHEE
jgi:methionine synthase II (cobalamin-independent)